MRGAQAIGIEWFAIRATVTSSGRPITHYKSKWRKYLNSCYGFGSQHLWCRGSQQPTVRITSAKKFTLDLIYDRDFRPHRMPISSNIE